MDNNVQEMSIEKIIEKAAIEQFSFSNYEMSYFNYETQTTFWGDFTIAELSGGIDAIKDTFDRAFNEWKTNKVFCTELAMVLNHKSWKHVDNVDLSKLYADLFYKVQDYVYSDACDKDFQNYYWEITD